MNFDVSSVDNMYRWVNSYGVFYTSVSCLLKQWHVEVSREAIKRALMEFLRESSGELIKDYKDYSHSLPL